jgi:hypothetical protein
MRAMIKKEIARVSIDDAARRVGRAMFGNEWVGAITTRETRLIERYLEGLHGPSASSIVPSQTTWIVGGVRWAEYPSDPSLVAEVVRARDRDDWCLEQWRRAFRWLEDHGFDRDAAAVEGEALARKIGQAFPQNSAALNTIPASSTASAWS